MSTKECGDVSVGAGRDGCPGAYAFFARYFLMPWQSCLDVGGGLGTGKKILLKRSIRVDAIDLDDRLAQFRVRAGRVEEEKDRSYDWVLAVDVIEHVPEDAAFLSHLLRVARKGVFLATCNVEHHPDRKWPYHQREYSPAQLAAMVHDMAPSARMLHFGGDTYGGHMALSHLSPEWEHQVVVCFLEGGFSARIVMQVRETALAFRRWLTEKKPKPRN